VVFPCTKLHLAHVVQRDLHHAACIHVLNRACQHFSVAHVKREGGQRVVVVHRKFIDGGFLAETVRNERDFGKIEEDLGVLHDCALVEHLIFPMPQVHWVRIGVLLLSQLSSLLVPMSDEVVKVSVCVLYLFAFTWIVSSENVLQPLIIMVEQFLTPAFEYCLLPLDYGVLPRAFVSYPLIVILAVVDAMVERPCVDFVGTGGLFELRADSFQRRSGFIESGELSCCQH